jgi:hypothetical protein
MSRLGLSVGRGTPESRAWPTTTWTVLILILPRRKRSPRCCARLARCPGAPTSWAIPPQRWMTPRPSSSLLRPAPAWSSSCTTSRCSNASCNDAKGRQDVEIISRVPIGCGLVSAVGPGPRWADRGRAGGRCARRHREGQVGFEFVEVTGDTVEADPCETHHPRRPDVADEQRAIGAIPGALPGRRPAPPPRSPRRVRPTRRIPSLGRTHPTCLLIATRRLHSRPTAADHGAVGHEWPRAAWLVQ